MVFKARLKYKHWCFLTYRIACPSLWKDPFSSCTWIIFILFLRDESHPAMAPWSLKGSVDFADLKSQACGAYHPTLISASEATALFTSPSSQVVSLKSRAASLHCSSFYVIPVDAIPLLSGHHSPFFFHFQFVSRLVSDLEVLGLDFKTLYA